MDERGELEERAVRDAKSLRQVVQVSRVRMNPYVSLLCRALREEGVPCDIIEGLSPRLVQPWVGKADVVHVHWLELLYSAQSLRAVLRRLAAVALGLFRAKAAGCKIVCTVHNLASRDPAYPVLDKMAQLTMYWVADALHVHDRTTAELLAENHGRSEGVYVIPHGSYIGAYRNECSRAEARSQLGLPAGAFVYLFLGQIRPYKGLEDLLDAFGRCEDAGSWLVIAGNLHDAEYARELARKVEGASRVCTWLQYVPDDEVQLFMNAADVCVLPYREVTTSGAAVLSFTFGTPIIAPDLGGFRDLAANGRGVLYAPDDRDGLLRALRRVRTEDTAEAGRKALAWAEQHSWTALAPEFLSMYAQTVQPR